MKVTPKLQRLIDEGLESPDATAHRDIRSLFQAAVEQIHRPDDELQQAMRVNRIYGRLSDDEWAAIKFFGPGTGLQPPGAIFDGVIRRLSKNSPEELALRLSVVARYEWAETQINPNGHFDELWRPLLLASAAHDRLAIRPIISLWDARTGKPNNRTYAAICEGLAGLVLRDRDRLHSAVEEAQKRKAPAYPAAVQHVIAAIESDDAARFAEGLSKMLSGFRRYMFGDEALGLLDPYAIGIYELAREFSSGIESEFDAKSKLPWDAEYVEWLHTYDETRLPLDAIDLPPLIQHAMVDMQPLEWAAKVRSPK